MSDSSNNSESRTRRRIQEAKNKARPGMKNLIYLHYSLIKLIKLLHDNIPIQKNM